MANNRKHNKNVPEDPWKDAKRNVHHFTRYDTDTHGRLIADYSEPDSKDNFSSRAHHEGSFDTRRSDDNTKDKIHSTDFDAGHHRRYVEKGDKNHIDGHSESYGDKTRNKNTWGEKQEANANREAKGCKGPSCKIAETHATLKTKSSDVDSTSKDATMSTEGGTGYAHGENGNTVETRGGDVNYDVTKDNHGKYSTGNTDHAAKKSFQIQALEGNVYVTAQKSAVIIKAGKKSGVINVQESSILLQVGGSSITIEEGKITIKASEIILDGTCHLGGQGGSPAGKCGGGCASKVMVN